MEVDEEDTLVSCKQMLNENWCVQIFIKGANSEEILSTISSICHGLLLTDKNAVHKNR